MIKINWNSKKIIFRNVLKDKDVIQIMGLVMNYYSKLEYSLPKTDLDIRILFESPDFLPQASYVAVEDKRIVGFSGALLREDIDIMEGEIIGLSTVYRPYDELYHIILRNLLDLSIKKLKDQGANRISTIATPLFSAHYRMLIEYGFKPIKAWYLMSVEKNEVRYPEDIAEDLKIIPLSQVSKDNSSRLDLAISVLNAAFFGELGGGWDKSEIMIKFRNPNFEPEGIFIGYSDNVPAGIIWVLIDYSLSKIRNTKIGWVAFLGLREGYRGRRYGRTLLAHGLKYLFNKGVEKVLLWVNSENSVAVRLYRMFNFSVEKAAHLMWYYIRE